MLLKLIRKIRNKLSKRKPESKEEIGTEFDWIWQPFKNDKDLEEDCKQLAFLIAQCSDDSIPDIPLKLDPRLVIPLCAIQLQNEIDLNKLYISEEELLSMRKSRYIGDLLIRKSLNNRTDEYSDKELIDEILRILNPRKRWQYLFESLDTQLQLELLYRLSNYRRPKKNDWRSLFEEIIYEFKTGLHYKLVLIIALLLSLGSVIEIFTIMLIQPESWVNGLMEWGVFVILVFGVVLWQGIRDQLEPIFLIRLGLLGSGTFWQEWWQLLRKNIVWEGVSLLSNAVDGAADVVGVMTGAMAGAMTGAMTGAVFGAMAGAVLWAVLGAVAGAVAGAVLGAVVWVVLGAKAVTKVGIEGKSKARVTLVVLAATVVGAVAATATATAIGALAGGIAIGLGIGIWYRAKDKTLSLPLRFLSIFAFPLFCWFPIVFIFTSVALYDRLSWGWHLIALFWVVVFGFCSFLWVRGRILEEKARNPLRGILDGVVRHS